MDEDLSKKDEEERFTSILVVASRLDCIAIAEFAERKLGDLGGLQRVLIGRQYAVPSLFLRGVKALCDREDFLSLEEAQILQLGDVVQIAKTREKLRAGAKWEEEKVNFML